MWRTCGAFAVFVFLEKYSIWHIFNKFSLQGEQYLYEDDWGEQMSPKTHPVIAVCDIIKKNIDILKGVPDDISPGQIIWEPSGNGVVGLGVYHKPRRLGIIFCTNRRSCIFHLSWDEQFSRCAFVRKFFLSVSFYSCFFLLKLYLAMKICRCSHQNSVLMGNI